MDIFWLKLGDLENQDQSFQEGWISAALLKHETVLIHPWVMKRFREIIQHASPDFMHLLQARLKAFSTASQNLIKQKLLEETNEPV